MLFRSSVFWWSCFHSKSSGVGRRKPMTSIADTADEHRPVWQSIRRGGAFKCPSCGEGQVFRKYLKVADNCSQCGEELHHHRADDAPPYFTIFIVGHIVVPAMLWIEMAYRPDRKSTRLNSSHSQQSRMPSSA